MPHAVGEDRYQVRTCPGLTPCPLQEKRKVAVEFMAILEKPSAHGTLEGTADLHVS